MKEASPWPPQYPSFLLDHRPLSSLSWPCVYALHSTEHWVLQQPVGRRRAAGVSRSPAICCLPPLSLSPRSGQDPQMFTAAGDMEKDSQTPSTVFTSFMAVIPLVIYLSVHLLPLISPLDCKLYEGRELVRCAQGCITSIYLSTWHLGPQKYLLNKSINQYTRQERKWGVRKEGKEDFLVEVTVWVWEVNECLKDKFGGACREEVTANLIPGSRYRMHKAGTKTIHVGG